MRLLFIAFSVWLCACDHVEPAPASSSHQESNPSYKSQKKIIADRTEKPFQEWWNARSGDDLAIHGNYVFHEQIRGKRKPLKNKFGKLSFLKNKEGSFVLLSRFIGKEQKKNNLVDIKLITPEQYIEYIPARDNQKAQRKVSELKGEQNKVAKQFLNTVMIFGRSYEDLVKQFAIRIKEQPNNDGEWSFTLIPKDSDVRKDLQIITVDMQRANYKKIVFKESKKSWIGFEFVEALNYEAKIQKQELLDAVK